MRSRLFFCLALLVSSHSNAFVLSGNFWEEGAATYRVGISGNSPSGTSWNTAFKRAMDSWSTATNFQFNVINTFINPCTNRQNGGFGDNISSVDFTADVCGNAFGNNTLAVTLTAGTCLNQQCTSGFKISDADIVFKNDESWDVYSGPLRNNNTIDFERVALHELGHALGLRHETTNTAMMQALVSDLNTLQADDINGANAIYTTSVEPPVVPPLEKVSSIYGVDILLPAPTVLNGPIHNVSLSGSLASGDASLDNKFLHLYQYTFANDTSVDLRLNSIVFDPFLYLVRISSTQDAIPAHTFSDDNSGVGSNAQIVKTVQAGTYWVGVSSATSNQKGSYALTMTTSNASPTKSFASFKSIYGVDVEINPNPSIAGNLSSSDFSLNGKHLDLYQFSVVNQIKMRIDLSASAFDPVLIVARLLPNGLLSAQEIDENFLLMNDDFGTSLNSRIEQMLTPGTYWIGVTSADNGQTGDYQIESTVVIP